MAEPLGHENQITFFNNDGHNHDGKNSSLVELQSGQIRLDHLNPALIEWFLSQTGSGGGFGGDGDVMPVPDLVLETPPIAPGASFTATAPWVMLSVVRFTRIVMSKDTECTLTFYHKSTFEDKDREFRAIQCANKFLWEAPWVHYDEDGAKEVKYKIENTGTQSAVFQITLKSGTMAANAYSRFVEAIQVNGTDMTGNLILVGGNGVKFRAEGQNIIADAVAPETVYVRTWAATPIKPVGFSSSAALSNTTALLNGRTDQNCQFGTGIQWVQADLGTIKTLAGVKVVMFTNDGRVFKDVRLQVSSDAASWVEVKSPGEVWATWDGFEVTFVSGLLARYVRLWCNGSNLNDQNYVSNISAMALSNKN